MHATVFVNVPYGVFGSHGHHMTETNETAEGCLRQLEYRLMDVLPHTTITLTFRPIDGMIFCAEMSSTIPIGVLYAQGYPALIHS